MNDSNRILGYGENVTDIALLLIAKLHKIIWVTRCYNLDVKEQIKCNDLESIYRRSIKYMLELEKGRLSKNDFLIMYGKNNALCKVINGNIEISI